MEFNNNPYIADQITAHLFIVKEELQILLDAEPLNESYRVGILRVSQAITALGLDRKAKLLAEEIIRHRLAS